MYLIVILFTCDLRLLHTTVTANYKTSNHKDCAVTIRYDFPADIYVDKYELATIALNRKVREYFCTCT